eukprot:c26514_g1_i2 orf=840-1592(+)
MGDAWKTCFHQSIYTMLSSQAVGIFTVLAISGSVALLALGKHKLFPLKNYAFEWTDDENQDTAKGLSSSIRVLTSLPGNRSASSSERESSDDVDCCDTYYITAEDQNWQSREWHGGRGAGAGDLERNCCPVTSDFSAPTLPQFVSRPVACCPSLVTNSRFTKYSPGAGKMNAALVGLPISSPSPIVWPNSEGIVHLVSFTKNLLGQIALLIHQRLDHSQFHPVLITITNTPILQERRNAQLQRRFVSLQM